MSKQQTMFFEHMDQLNQFLHEKNVDITDPLLCAQLRLFYRFAFRTMGSTNAMTDILATISPTLKGQIALAGWGGGPPHCGRDLPSPPPLRAGLEVCRSWRGRRGVAPRGRFSIWRNSNNLLDRTASP
eukprot:1179134-Prorocentrum_minimum.AAC.3